MKHSWRKIKFSRNRSNNPLLPMEAKNSLTIYILSFECKEEMFFKTTTSLQIFGYCKQLTFNGMTFLIGTISINHMMRIHMPLTIVTHSWPKNALTILDEFLWENCHPLVEFYDEIAHLMKLFTLWLSSMREFLTLWLSSMRELLTLWLSLGMGTGDRSTCDTGLSIAVNRSETGPHSMRFGFLCTLEA